MVNSGSSETDVLPGYFKVCRVDELKENEGRRFIVNNVEVAVFKINNQIFALSNLCPHQHSALIYDGFIEDGCVVCPAHGWMFDLKTGKLPAGGKGLDTFPVRVVKDEVFIKAEKKKFNW